MTIRNRAVETTEIPSILLNRAIQDASVAIQGKLPTKDAVRKMVQRSIDVPEAYTTYKSSHGELEQFLLWDSGRGDNERILIFLREYIKFDICRYKNSLAESSTRISLY
ncbi:hypothetical protein MXB_4203 [Myxobolus squamalis]|nr:hypothetical protein MXB_4203 [Myxobolus squamalis]